MKKLVLSAVAALALAAGAPVHAQTAATAESTAAVKELMETMNMRAVMRASMQHMVQQLPQMLRQMGEAGINANAKLDAEQKRQALARMEEQMPKVLASMNAVFNDPKLAEEMEQETMAIYARNYTADEMKQVTAFYRTPVGAKMLATMPKVMQESMAAGQKVMMPRIAKLAQDAGLAK